MYIIEIPTEHNLKDKKEINVCYELPYFKYRLYTLQMDSLKKKEHIRCIPTFSCKLCKLQSGLPDQHPRGMGEGNFTINHPPLITLLQIPLPLPLRPPLDVDPVAQIGV